jgi:hypothetical protein
MTDVEVACRTGSDGWTCTVSVDDPTGSGTSHEVRVTRADLARFAPGAEDPVDLVKRSFAFLLARESKESILRSFDLPVIGSYFPDYEREIRADSGPA